MWVTSKVTHKQNIRDDVSHTKLDPAGQSKAPPSRPPRVVPGPHLHLMQVQSDLKQQQCLKHKLLYLFQPLWLQSKSLQRSGGRRQAYLCDLPGLHEWPWRWCCWSFSMWPCISCYLHCTMETSCKFGWSLAMPYLPSSCTSWQWSIWHGSRCSCWWWKMQMEKQQLSTMPWTMWTRHWRLWPDQDVCQLSVILNDDGWILIWFVRRPAEMLINECLRVYWHGWLSRVFDPRGHLWDLGFDWQGGSWRVKLIELNETTWHWWKNSFTLLLPCWIT